MDGQQRSRMRPGTLLWEKTWAPELSRVAVQTAPRSETAIRWRESRSPHKRVTIQVAEPDLELPTIHVQHDRVVQSVINVVLNGLEAAPDNGWVCLRA